MILVTGFTGNTGSLVLEKLSKIIDMKEVVGVSRLPVHMNTYDIELFVGDLDNTNTLNELFDKYPIKSIIHIANIRYSSSLLAKANEYEVDKVILIHTTGVYSKFRSYSSLYEKIENEILNNTYSNTNYIILRPTMIYGNHRDHNMHKLIKFINRSPVFPVFGKGSTLMQPIHVEDLANTIVTAYQSRNLYNEDFDLSGGSVVTYKEVITTIKENLGKNTKLVYIPITLAVFGANILKKIMPRPLISVEQVKRLQEDKAYSNKKAKELLNYNPRTFNEGIIQEINLLKEKGIIR
ncbi:NAD-dependent epimerase/dehydratase family protein [Planococcus sp. A6]|uniref:NAD-dependent epimerase/dehydratase family protein n=1 Tax=Planococcus sp. A6 TaxID=2992760 RepID=UPI00237AA49D|nr:NAD-dependent epimerase/dehydratase family protein [Planococcus sp. A6]MDE0582095.1 NAD-dependent epimerase/dehydratase family protein [Planococcus sp. A6]